MKNILEKKIRIIPILAILIISVFYLPLSLGLGIVWLILTKITDQKLKYSMLVIIGFLMFQLNPSWISVITSPNKIEQEKTIENISTPTPEILKPSPTQTTRETEMEVSTPLIATPKSVESSRQEAIIIKVIDGDTVDVSFNEKTERIRVIGIDTPETVDPRKSVQCFGKEASDQAKLYLKKGTTVELEADPSQGERDKYKRLLRYIWTDSGRVDFGKDMISLGYAYEYTYNLPYKYQEIYKKAEKEAEQGKKGLWADNACLVAVSPIR
jgi:micrococcal nuclease